MVLRILKELMGLAMDKLSDGLVFALDDYQHLREKFCKEMTFIDKLNYLELLDRAVIRIQKIYEKAVEEENECNG